MSTFTPEISAADAADELRELLREDPTVYVVQRRVSQSGMNRKLSLFVIGKRGHDAATDLVNVTYLVAAVNGVNVHNVDGCHALSVSGAGMDMHFATVYGLSRRLYTDGERDAGYRLTHRTI